VKKQGAPPDVFCYGIHDKIKIADWDRPVILDGDVNVVHSTPL
jgi:hypothetical protein